MALGPSHHALLQPMLKAAWAVAGAGRSNLEKDAWYRAGLKTSTGWESSKDCSPVGDFIKAMAHFEEIAANGTFWREKLKGLGAG